MEVEKASVPSNDANDMEKSSMQKSSGQAESAKDSEVVSSDQLDKQRKRDERKAAKAEKAARALAKAEGALQHPRLLDRSLYLGKDIPLNGTAHQAGTLRFGEDPAQSVLDLNCKAHQLDNLYVTDASFFPSIGAVNPTLTIIANALRVADRIRERLVA